MFNEFYLLGTFQELREFVLPWEAQLAFQLVGFYLLTRSFVGCFVLFFALVHFEANTLFLAPALFGLLQRENRVCSYICVLAWLYFSSSDAFLGLLLAVCYKPKDVVLWLALVVSVFSFPVPEAGDFPPEARLAEVSSYNEANPPYLGGYVYPSSISASGVEEALGVYEKLWIVVMVCLGLSGARLLLLPLPLVLMQFWPEFLRLVPGQQIHASPHVLCALWFVYVVACSNLKPVRLFMLSILGLVASIYVTESAPRFSDFQPEVSDRLSRDFARSPAWKNENLEFRCIHENLNHLPGAITGPAETLDNDKSTRWSGEALEFELSLPAYAIRLNTGDFKTDFPKAFSLYKGGTKIQEVKTWDGPMRWSPSGLPYRGFQHDVLLRFSEPLEAGRYRVVLDSRDQYFDWSVAELEAYGTKCSK